MIRTAILRLFKQHHIKEYTNLTEGQYSCWGNYDSMSVEMVTHQKNTLIVSRDALGLTDMWYQLSNILGEQDGTYSQQCIGLIYKGNKILEDFLVPDEYFCCACMLKLRNSYQTEVYDNLMLHLGNSEDAEGYVDSICFRTMDNADAIVLIKGNSYKKIMNQVIDISRKVKDIVYSYSVCGVNQQYLRNDKWEGAKHALVDDRIHQITGRIVAKPTIDVSKLEAMFGGSGEWAWVFGNTDIVWKLEEKGQTIKRAIDLMRPYTDEMLAGHAVASHSHPLYGNQIYGITTEVAVQYKTYQTQGKIIDSFPEVPKGSQKNLTETKWCRKRIGELREQLKEIRRRKNDMLYSYYLALIQSLTLIIPYEESLFAKDLFYIVFPSLLMFHKQLDTALTKQDGTIAYNEMDAEIWNELIKNLADYLEMLEQIIYRSIHSEQTFFMVPGYCGVLYTILPKLSMMYMALLYAGIEVLKDDSEVYECCLYPVIDSKPSTTEVDFHLLPAERLIEIKVSQRSMFSANLMPVLLLHELSHYVSSCRNRSFRAFCMIQTWGAFLTKKLLWNDGTLGSNFQKECLNLIYEENRKEVSEYITKELECQIGKENQRREEVGQELYFDDIFLMLVDFSQKILQDDDGILRTKLQKKGNLLKKKICEGGSSEDFTKRICELEDLYIILKQRMGSCILKSNCIEQLEKSMKLCFKETYADIIALHLIGFQNSNELFERYLEVFYLSEGVEFDVSNCSNEEINRVAVTVTVLSEMDIYAKKNWNTLVEDKKEKYRKNKRGMKSIDYLVLYAHIYITMMQKGEESIKHSILKKIAKTMPSETEESIAEISTTWHSQMSYFSQVAEELLGREAEAGQITEPQKKKKAELRMEAKSRIRKLYSLLSDQDQINDEQGLQAFDDIIRWYTDLIDKKEQMGSTIP